jgi:UDP-GlcNAc:undecaprenyl-phosphate/decaprenyl-phosphate GlcNAc-1-phosphate transferase
MAFLLAALGSIALTPLVIRLAWRLGAVARPRADRWHQQPTALLGGVAIYAAAVTAALLVLPRALGPEAGVTVQWLGIGAGATLMFVLGLIDDRYGMHPLVKLAGQTAAAGLLLLTGTGLSVADSPWLAVPLTLFWVVGITNAVNLLDNMDGVVSGVVAVAALSLAAHAAGSGRNEVAGLALCLAGACAGFLFFNAYPARIFMGDCGSLFLGFSISALALAGRVPAAGGGVDSLFLPVAVLAVPILDTSLVTISRRLHGRSVWQGGRDHTTHRLVALGLSERSVAFYLWAGSAALGCLALSVGRLPMLAVLTLAALVGLGLGLFGTFLAAVPVYPAAEPALPRDLGPVQGRRGGSAGTSGTGASERDVRARWWLGGWEPRSAFLLGYPVDARPAARLLLDALLVPVSFAAAHLLRFDAVVPTVIWEQSLRLLPLWIGVKVAAMALCGTHRTLWRYAGVADALATLKGSSLASLVLSVVIAVGGGFQDVSRAVLILDWLVFTALAVATRLGFVLLSHTFSSAGGAEGESVIVVGADESGVAAARQLRGSPRHRPLGFVDDDRRMRPCRLDGLPVLGSVEDLPRLVQEQGAQVVVIPSGAAAAERAALLCGSHGIPCSRWVSLIPSDTVKEETCTH